MGASGRVPLRRRRRVDVALAATSTTDWDKLVKLVGAPPLTDGRFRDLETRQREQPYIDRVLNGWTQCRDKWAAWQELRAQGIAAMPVMINADLIHDPTSTSVGSSPGDQPGVGARLYPGRHLQFAPPLTRPLGPSSRLGADNETILRDLPGYGSTRVAELTARGALAERPADA